MDIKRGETLDYWENTVRYPVYYLASKICSPEVMG
jgi:hypothetical protein